MKPGRILLFIAAVMAALAALGAVIPDEGFEVAGHYVGFTSLHRLAQPDEPEPVAIEAEAEPPEMLALLDSVNYYSSVIHSGDLRFWLPDEHYFDPFWRQARAAKREGRVLRVLHYGDSQIEMDHITSRLRAYMQSRFGGGGPGMIPFRPITPSPTVRGGASGELLHLASFGDSTVVKSRGDYGPMMQCFRMADGSATATVRAAQGKQVDNRAKAFSRVTLLFNNRGQRLAASLTDRQHRGKPIDSLCTASGIGSVAWRLDSASNSLQLSVRGQADLYALLVDDGPGVAVDNIPMRGCSGQQFTLVPEGKLAAAYAQMDVGLVIMQFGGNSVPYLKTTKQVSTYCQSLGRQIDHVRRCCPKARVLFVGPSDMSTRQRGQMQTYPIIPELIDSLAATATAHGAAFWSIYHAMGGANTMPQWTRQGLAGQDYIHFSQRGADLMGDRMAQALDNLYALYLLERRMNKRNNGN
ncbi:MAG: hypothetical protein IJ760_01530 [Bacteroidales bacterium]|nr:hypothetical protein [Bacteroidales bacterium]